MILGNPLKPDLLGMAAGHLYYFLTVLYPLAGGRYAFKTPLWVQKLVAFWGEGYQMNAPVRKNPAAGVAFQGRSYRLSGSRTTTSTQGQTSTSGHSPQPNQADGVAFRGRSYCLNGQ
ncbi:hypothetical protein U1Q18_043185 [Sarracenia purpurea var. burkii]